MVSTGNPQKLSIFFVEAGVIFCGFFVVTKCSGYKMLTDDCLTEGLYMNYNSSKGNGSERNSTEENSTKANSTKKNNTKKNNTKRNGS